jgi:hypothetical protein
METFPYIVSAKPGGNFTLQLGFSDGTRGTVDLAPVIMETGGMFLPLRNPEFFAQVSVDHEAGTVVWPNGLDLDPDALYSRAHSIPIS